MNTIDQINFIGRHVLIRVDFNVPLDNNYNITDDTRIRASLPTIQKVLSDGGSAILMSHLGRPKHGFEEKYSLKHIVEHLSNLLATKVYFATDCIGIDTLNKSKQLKHGEVLLLENVRFHTEETKGEKSFASALAKNGDFYINDAFGSAHRAHASTTVIAHFFSKENTCFGYLMNAEVANATKVLHHAEQPLTAIIGGAKVSDKILIIENLLNVTQNIIIGGGMSYTFLKALGYNIGKSICEDDKLSVALDIIEKAKAKNVRLLLPIDHVIADNFSKDANTQIVDATNTPDDWMGLDIGYKTIDLYSTTILNSKTILWNGPMGVFEMEKFEQGTKSIALAVAKATSNGTFSLIGGGDSVAAVNKFNLSNQVSFVSTGGGAMLEFFEGKLLPGVEAIMH